MTPAELAAALPGRNHRKSESGWMACCPAHSDRTPSLSIDEGSDDRLLFRCFAGCQQGDVIAALSALGLWGGEETKRLSPAEIKRRRVEAEASRQRSINERIGSARRIWNECVTATGTQVQAYLKSRAITICPPTLRYHSGLKHAETGLLLPAMVAPVQAVDGTVTGVHWTFLRADGCGKAPVSSPRKMLGACSGGAARLGPAAESMIVGEGIESTLSAMMGGGMPGWAALSAHGVETLLLPPLPLASIVTIAADNDASGRGQSAAEFAARRWTTEGRTVRIAKPPAGMDFNDVLIAANAARNVA